MKRFAVLGLLAVSAPAAGRESLGVYEQWGAFRDERPLRCYAVAEPETGGAGRGTAFASVANWPGRLVRGQLHIRLARPRAADARVTLTLGDRRWPLISGGLDAWAPDRRSDAAIVAAMRSAPRMTVESRGADGRLIRDGYALRGAATAIDAAALGCARRG